MKSPDFCRFSSHHKLFRLLLKVVKNYFLGKKDLNLSEAFSESLSFLSRLLNCQVLKRKRFFFEKSAFCCDRQKKTNVVCF